MKKINIIYVGDIKEEYYKKAVAEYEKRLSTAFTLTGIVIKEEKISDTPSENEIAAVLKKEAVKISEKLTKNSYKIAMCVEGRNYTSEQFSTLIYSPKVQNAPAIDFLIGSSHGLDKDIKSSADLLLSLSYMTFPHRLARIMLAEQLYRAYTIQSNIKYHK